MVLNQQAYYFKYKEDIEVLNVHVLFIGNLCKFFGDLQDEGNYAALGMDANNNVWDGEVTKALLEIGMFEPVIINPRGESVLATCATNKQCKQLIASGPPRV